MSVRYSRQQVEPMFLLLLLLVISVAGNTCGCWGTNQVYVHYKPPVTGWFHLSHRHNFLFERVYSVYTAEPQTHRFQLKYIPTRGHWLLLEKKAERWIVIINTKRQHNTTRENLIISCPTGECLCQKLQVTGSSCSSINGIFYRRERSNLIPLILNDTSPTNHPSLQIKPGEHKRRRSQCLLRQLGECLHRRKLGMTPAVKGGYHCGNHIQPMINQTGRFRSYPDQYLCYNYKVVKDVEQDFWMIESESKVYAVSRNTGPCPDQLTPDSSIWVRTDDNLTENITVTCTTWDNPFGD